jgi:hypothetical protein
LAFFLNASKLLDSLAKSLRSSVSVKSLLAAKEYKLWTYLSYQDVSPNDSKTSFMLVVEIKTARYSVM